MKQNNFDKYDRKILVLLKKARRPLTTSQIKDKLSISWITAKNHLDELHKKGYLVKGRVKKSKRIYWDIFHDKYL